MRHNEIEELMLRFHIKCPIMTKHYSLMAQYDTIKNSKDMEWMYLQIHVTDGEINNSIIKMQQNITKTFKINRLYVSTICLKLH